MYNNTTIQHVLITGGGPPRSHIRSTIFEIRPTRSDSGGSISLGPNALQISGVGAYGDDGEKFGEITAGEANGNEGYPSVRVMRSTLHKVLLDAGEEMGEMITVKWGAKLSRIGEDEQAVRAYFEDWSKAKVPTPCTPKYAGTSSDLKQAAATPTFDGLYIVYGFSLHRPPSFHPLTSPSRHMFAPSGVFMTIPIHPEGKKLAWVINQSVKERSREEWRELEQSDYDDIQTQQVRSLLDNADEKKARVWAAGICTPRVCLIGDAAHGQGSAMAFEDAAILTRLLTSKDTTSYDQLFRRFEAIRRPRLKRIRQSSKASGGAVKVRAFFAWKGGVIQHAEQPTYDVDQHNFNMNRATSFPGLPPRLDYWEGDAACLLYGTRLPNALEWIEGDHIALG
ncbi:hypothetical protein B0H19DRAFT_1066033 [Mycena capillaripes]|nr:hypothetical protein B0H19DRAFT_1066033 [Mycena capillaripes]